MSKVPMLEIAKLPLARRLWRICKEFKIPINDPIIRDMDLYDLEFYEYSIICDNPELLKKLENHYVDPDFDKWLEDFDKEQETLQRKQNKENQGQNHVLDFPDKETIAWKNTPKPKTKETPNLNMEEYEINATDNEINDWVLEG